MPMEHFDNFKWLLFQKPISEERLPDESVLVERDGRGYNFSFYEYNSSEWVISDYERKELIVDRFITLANLIYCSESCSIVEC